MKLNSVKHSEILAFSSPKIRSLDFWGGEEGVRPHPQPLSVNGEGRKPS